MATNYTNESQQRLVDLILLLAGNEFHGLAPGEIAKAMKANPATTTRDLFNLKEKGVAEQIEETGRWRLGPKLVQIALSFSTALTRASQRLDGIEQRYNREPN
ncbi:MAG: IclR family transcriptional regulator [Rhodocyclaceae bacterium]|nr:IclR family transcriptional regulator [Rhodocyclaceae bacterium]